MTCREVFISLKNINFRRNIDFEINAKLHGAEIKGGDSSEKVSFTKDKDALLKREMDRINKERFGADT